MDNGKLYSVTFQTPPGNDSPGKTRQIIVVAASLNVAAFVAERERLGPTELFGSETVSIAEILQPVVFA